MATENISKYHGVVSLCDCGIYQHPERQGERACRFCFGRGFVADCLGCDGKGRNEVPVNGKDPKLGMMSSTCNFCGGVGKFAVNKPADWVDEPVAEEETTETAA